MAIHYIAKGSFYLMIVYYQPG